MFVAFAVVLCFAALMLRRRSTTRITLFALERFAELDSASLSPFIACGSSSSTLSLEDIFSCST